MNHRVPKLGLLAGTVLALVAVVFYGFLNNMFGGPQIRFAEAYEIKASFRDTQQLLTKSPLLIRGVPAGEITGFEVKGSRAELTFTIKQEYAPIYRDATVQLGLRSLIGEPFVELDPGTPRAGAMSSGSTIPRERSFENVELEEALTIFKGEGRRDFNNLQRTFGRAARSDRSSDQVSAAYGSLRRIVREARVLTETLRGQEGDISGFVTNGRAVVRELGERERSLNRLVTGARVTLEAMSSKRTALEQGMAELPRLLSSGERTLAHVQPLLRESRPLVADLGAAAPDLRPTFEDLRPTAVSARRAIEGLKPLIDAAVPTLRKALPVVRAGRPATRRLEPALRNLVPILRYIAPYKRSYSSYFANPYDGFYGFDSKGIYGRFAFPSVPGQSTGTRNDDSFYVNNYSPPNRPLEPPSPDFKYPRLKPFEPRFRRRAGR